MLLSGAAAGLVGMQSLLGDVHAYGLAIPTGLGFNGIAVALLGRNHPAGIVPAALLFGFLDSTAGALQLKNVPSPIVEVMQAIILFTVVIVNEVVGHWMAKRTQSKTAAALGLAGAPA
jgi:simple sugar transport system permease protein